MNLDVFSLPAYYVVLERLFSFGVVGLTLISTAGQRVIAAGCTKILLKP